MLRQVSSYIVSLFLFVSVSLFIISMSALVVLDYSTYDQAFTETGAYYEAEELFASIGYALTPDQQRDVIRNMLAYLEGKSTQPIVIQKGFTEEQVRDWVLDLPTCDADNMEMCRPAGVGDEEMVAAALTQFGPPEPVDLLESDPSVREGVDQARAYLRHVRVAQVASIIIAIVSALLLLFLNRRQLKSGLRWIDSDLIVAGASSVVTSLGLLQAIPAMLGQAAPGIADSAIVRAVYIVLSSILGAMLWWGAGALILGLLILVGSLFVKNNGGQVKEPKKKAAKQ